MTPYTLGQCEWCTSRAVADVRLTTPDDSDSHLVCRSHLRDLDAAGLVLGDDHDQYL